MTKTEKIYMDENGDEIGMDGRRITYGGPDYHDWFDDSRRHAMGCCALTNKDAHIKTFLHYSDADAHKERTVFGEKKPGLHYNYSDRLSQWNYDGWRKACEQASNTEGVKENTARWFETALRIYHDSDDLDLQHIILGCNMSNGYHYHVYGYTYTSKSGK